MFILNVVASVLVLVGIAILALIIMSIRVADQYERSVVFRLGKFNRSAGPGLYFIWPLIEWQTKLDPRTVTANVEQQEGITRDNVPIKVDAVIWYRIVDPERAVIEVKQVSNAVVQVSLTTLRTVLGQHTLDEILKAQDTIAEDMQQQIDHVTGPWGVKVELVQMKSVEIPPSMQRAMAQEAEALREKRARLIKAEAELDAAEQLRRAAEVIMQNPAGLELRRMQMITEVGAEQNTMIIVMMPSEFVAMATRKLPKTPQAMPEGHSMHSQGPSSSRLPIGLGRPNRCLQDKQMRPVAIRAAAPRISPICLKCEMISISSAASKLQIMARRLQQSRIESTTSIGRIWRTSDSQQREYPVTETVAAIVAAHRAGIVSPAQTVARSYLRIRDTNDPAVFISLRDENEAIADAESLKTRDARDLPLFGVPVAVKDNIDVLGMPTTAACPAFSYRPSHDATSVARLRQAGAIIIGKTNLDQFATGLVGVRSPHGIPKNPIRPDLIPGGSSSGSAVAVAAGLVPLALGTDTAGSGRVPALLNNIVGLKPSLGMVSTAGVVPACRTLDCVSVFSLTVDDAVTALAAMAGPDRADPFSRDRPLGQLTPLPAKLRLGVPRNGQLIFFGDKASDAAYGEAMERWSALGAELVEFDMEPFYEAARLLYEGPWITERYLVIRNLLASSPDSIHPVTREVIAPGSRQSATETFSALYRLQGLRKFAERVFTTLEAIVLPTTPTVYTTKQVLANPIELNSRLGTYANFVNLLDLCGLALPASMRPDDIPFGITLVAPAGRDALLASIGRIFHADTRLTVGARGLTQPPLAPLPAPTGGDLTIAVVGAHMSGMALNGELRMLGGRLIEAAVTAADYKLYALPTTPPKPGMLRVDAGQGRTIEIEIWALSPAAFGQFIAAIPPPLSIGTIRLADGRNVKGFLVEAAGLCGARDISAFGGWRAYMAEAAV